MRNQDPITSALPEWHLQRLDILLDALGDTPTERSERAFVQNLRRGHYELGVEFHPQHRLPAAFTELALAI